MSAKPTSLDCPVPSPLAAFSVGAMPCERRSASNTVAVKLAWLHSQHVKKDDLLGQEHDRH